MNATGKAGRHATKWRDMDSNETARHRLAVAVSSKSRRLASEIRSRLPWIREHLASGYTHDQMVRALAEVGVEISRGTLRKYLYREAKADGLRQAMGLAVPLQITPAQSKTLQQVAPTASPPPLPKAAANPPSFEDAMDPAKRAARAAKYLQPKPLIRRVKPA